MNNLKMSTRSVLLIGLLASARLGVGGLGSYGIHRAGQARMQWRLDETHRIPGEPVGVRG
jgi:hypothetical protein